MSEGPDLLQIVRLLFLFIHEKAVPLSLVSCLLYGKGYN